MKRFVSKFLLAFAFLFSLYCQKALAASSIEVAPLSCYAGLTVSQMNANAASTGGATPFATWTAAYNYAVANSVTTINFAPGYYKMGPASGGIGVNADWGDADGGHNLLSGMVVNGNGAILDNTSNGSTAICFATMASNSTLTGFTFKGFAGVPSGGALAIPSTASGYVVSNCTFDNCNWGTDAVKVAVGANTTGTIIGCNFIRNSNPGAVSPTTVGSPTSSALYVTGSALGDLNIINTTFSCNFSNDGGGAADVQGAHVDFVGCTFSGNEANSSNGGAIELSGSAQVTFTNTNFTCNFTSGGTTWWGGAVAITDMAKVDFTGCKFSNNGRATNNPDWISSEDTQYGGAIYVGNSNNAATQGALLSISNTQFYNNCALLGGGIYADVSNNISVVNSYFSGNFSGGTTTNNSGGSAVFVRRDATACGSQTGITKAYFENVTFSGNKSASSNSSTRAGALKINGACTSTSDIDIINSVLDNNLFSVATSSAAGTSTNESNFTCLNGTTVDLTNVTLTNNLIAATASTVTAGTGPGFTGVTSGVTACSSCPGASATIVNCTNQGSIRGIVFDDTSTPDGNSTSNSVMAGVTVQLLAADGVTVLATMVTGADGSYLFTGLDAGVTYYIRIVPPSGQYLTFQNNPGSNTTNDSDFGISSGLSGPITICPTCSGTNTTVLNNTDANSSFLHYGFVNAGLTSQVLPINLVSFSGKRENESNIIRWKTSSEINASHFELLVSKDGINFETLHRKAKSGNEFQGAEYEFIHKNLTSNLYYYRLKMVDNDSKYTFSSIISLSNKLAENMKIYPNPVNDRLYIKKSTGETLDSEYTFKIFNQLGTEISSGNAPNGFIEVGDLPRGVYSILIEREKSSEKSTHRFMKQ